jgi:hypothetical protein
MRNLKVIGAVVGILVGWLLFLPLSEGWSLVMGNRPTPEFL